MSSIHSQCGDLLVHIYMYRQWVRLLISAKKFEFLWMNNQGLRSRKVPDDAAPKIVSALLFMSDVEYNGVH